MLIKTDGTQPLETITVLPAHSSVILILSPDLIIYLPNELDLHRDNDLNIDIQLSNTADCGPPT